MTVTFMEWQVRLDMFGAFTNATLIACNWPCEASYHVCWGEYKESYDADV